MKQRFGILHAAIDSTQKYYLRLFINSSHTLSADNNNYENIKVGNKVSTFRNVTEEDIQNFAKLTNDYNPIHINSSKSIAHGAFLNGLVSGVLGTQLPGPGTMVIEQIIRYPNPCYIGDSLEVSIEITSARKIIKCKYTCIANTHTVVMEGEAKLVMKFDIDKIKSN